MENEKEQIVASSEDAATVNEPGIVLGNKKRRAVNRRDALKMCGLAATAGLVASPLLEGLASTGKAKGDKKKWVMVIDRQKCMGCGSCTIGCKNENNIPDGMFWASKISETIGVFPNVRYDYMPTLCNHCDNAPCVKVCPTSAMHKAKGGITMHNSNKCIGCRYCMTACPYNVISFNDRKAHPRWRINDVTMEGCTASPVQLNEQVGGEVIPYYNPDRESEDFAGIRPMGVVEKCTLCNHRIEQGLLPYCVKKCPSKARVFGDLNDPNSEVNYLLGKYKPYRLKEDLGTEPKVYYIRSYNPGAYPTKS